MTMTLDHAQSAPRIAKSDDEPWVLWAGILVFLNILVISGMTFGLAGLVAVMAPAAICMVGVLVAIVLDGL